MLEGCLSSLTFSLHPSSSPTTLDVGLYSINEESLSSGLPPYFVSRQVCSAQVATSKDVRLAGKMDEAADTSSAGPLALRLLPDNHN